MKSSLSVSFIGALVFLESAWALVPGGNFDRAPIQKCAPWSIENEILLGTKGMGDWATYLEECHDHLSRFSTQPLPTLLTFGQLKYKTDDIQDIKNVTFFLKDGTQLPALFASRDSRPRPFVIVSCGAGCGTHDLAARYMLTHFFDALDFHVVLLASSTSKQWTRANRRLSAGGLAEGARIYQLFQQLSAPNSPYHKLASSWHVAGLSLGGESALFAGAIDSLQQKRSIGAHFSSVSALCSVTDLETSIANVDSNSLVGVLFRSIFKSTLTEFFKIRDPDQPIMNVPTGSLTRYIPDLAKKDLENEISNLPPELVPLRLETNDDFWNSQRFNVVADYLRLPTLMIASSDDPVVPYETNTGRLQKLQNPSVTVVKLSRGAHCAASVSYGWPLISSLLRSHILNATDRAGIKSSYLKSSRQEDKIKLSMNVQDHLREGEMLWGWSFALSKREVEIRFQVFEPTRVVNSIRCEMWTPQFAPFDCFHPILVKLNSILSEEILDGRALTSDAERESATRFLNSRFSVVDESNGAAVGIANGPLYLRRVE